MKPTEPDRFASPVCPERQAIQADLLRAISDLVELTFQQIHFLKTGDHMSALDLVTDLQQKSEQERRAYSALLEHVKEHGCRA
jgi:hypothetical protein